MTGIFFLLIIKLTTGGEFRYLLTQDGLPDGEINSIVQDSTGNMWFATWTGLVKYDGYEYKLFRPELGKPLSLPEKKIKQLFIDSDDNLWIATSMNLSRYNKDDNSFITYRFNDVGSRGVNISGLNEVEKHLVVHAVEGLFLIPLAEAGNAQYVLNRLQVNYSNEPVYNFFSFSKSAGNKFVLVSNGSNKSTVFFSTLKINGNNSSIDVDFNIELSEIVNDIVYVGAESSFYFATSNGLISYEEKNGSLSKNKIFPGKPVRNLLVTSNNHIFYSLFEPNLLYLDLHTGIAGKYESNPYLQGSLLDNEIQTLFEDFSGNLWIGHQGQGISILNLYKKKFYSFIRDPFQKVSLNSNTVMCFEGTENEIIIGCRSNGINIVSKRQTTGNKISYQRIPLAEENGGTLRDGIWDIAKQNDSLFWVGTEMGLFQLRKSKRVWTLSRFNGEPALHHSIRKIYIDSNNNIWCGSHGFGLFLIPNLAQNKKGKNYQYEAVPENPSALSDGVILDIYLDSDERFWIGTNNGLNLLKGSYENLDLSGKGQPDLHFKRYVASRPLDNYLNNNEINCFFENYDGRIWMATQGGGINILDPVAEKFSQLTTEDGLPSNDVIAMIPDEAGNLWISTSRGLVRYNRFNQESSLSIFDSSDGVQGEVFMINSAYKASDGQLFFGGDKGFTCFYPRDIKLNEIKPRISFTNLKIKNRLVNLGDTLSKGNIFKTVLDKTTEIELPYKSNVFSIGTSVLHYQNPESNSIEYMLKGLHKSWITVPAALGNIYLSNIPVGKYTLLARAVNSDGFYSSETKEMDITINPPWYGTGFFVSFYILLFVLVAYGIIYFIMSRQKLVYQKKIDKITIESNEQKMIFLTNIAHELRTPLSLITAPVEDMVKNVPEDSPWKEHFSMISRNSKYLLRLINQIIDFRRLNAGKLDFKPQTTDVSHVVENVVINFKGHDAHRNIKLHLDMPEFPVIGVIDVQKFEEVLYNLLSNAFKHTPSNHAITVSLKQTGGDEKDEKSNIHLTVFNEGKGIDESVRERIFERFYKVDDSAEGAGIGLSFAKSLIEMHQGKISVESIDGKGVAFHVKVPTGEINLVSGEPYISNGGNVKEVLSLPEEIKIQSSRSESILIVEDNSELRDFLVKIFSRYYKCVSAENGAVAWELIKEDPPSAVISDILMPKSDGLNLCKKIKGNKSTCHIPVLLLTAKDSPEQINEGFSVGADSYVTKPFDVELLVSQTDRLIQNRELIREKYRSENYMIEVNKGTNSRDEEFLEKVKKILDTNVSDPELNVNSLSQQLNISTTQLYRKLKELTGYSPVEFIRMVKLQKAYTLLYNKNNTVKEVCYLTGFNNMSYFIKCFREHFGVTPANFRDNGKIIKEENVINNQ